MKQKLTDFVKKETVLVIAAILAVLSAFSAPPVIGIDGLQLRAACIPLQTGSSGCIVHGTSLLVVGYCSRFFRVLQGT